MPDNLIVNKKIAYYTGCFANYYYPEVGKAVVKVLHKNGVEIIVPDQVCCALPMIAKGNIREAYKNMEYNLRKLGKAVEDGYAIISTCTSCQLMIKRDYIKLIGSQQAEKVAQNIYLFSEYMVKLKDMDKLNTDFQSIHQTVFYHTPCHLRAQEIDSPTIKLLQLIPDIIIKHISQECCGMGGAYGNEKINYQLSKEIASKLYSEIEDHPTDRIVTDCGGCKLQIESGTGLKVDHPIILINEAYSL